MPRETITMTKHPVSMREKERDAMRKQNYLVISYDDDEQQTFFDVIRATSGAAAKDIVGKVRGDYADVIDALTEADCEGFLEATRAADGTETPEGLAVSIGEKYSPENAL